MKTHLKEYGVGTENFEKIASRIQDRGMKLGEHANIGKKEILEILNPLVVGMPLCKGLFMVPSSGVRKIAGLIILLACSPISHSSGGTCREDPYAYNFSGQADAWAPSRLFSICLGSDFPWIVLTVVSFFPSLWNYPVKVTPANAQFLYLCSLNLWSFSNSSCSSSFRVSSISPSMSRTSCLADTHCAGGDLCFRPLSNLENVSTG
jgi:hypothetical protein